MKSYITSIATAVPSEPIPQMKIASFMSQASKMNEEERKKLEVLYRASGISSRHSVIPDFGLKKGEYQFFSNEDGLVPLPSVEKRMRLYEEKALGLCVEAALKSIERIDESIITHLITVSCTGMYAPGIDIELINALGLKTDISRTCINYMGCYAAFNAMKVADAFCKADPKAVVLVVAVELCTIHYQNKMDHDSILSNALFGDGAASFLVHSQKFNNNALRLESFHCDLALKGKDEMAWSISDFGFEMKLSNEVPYFIKVSINALIKRLIGKSYCSIEDIDAFAIHPGGKRILEVIEEELKIEKEKIQYSYDILRNYGNMSSVTILFVLKNIIDSDRADLIKKIICLAFGPGLTMESILMDLVLFDETSDLKSTKSEYQFFS